MRIGGVTKGALPDVFVDLPKVGHGTLLFLAGLWLCKNAESLRFSESDCRSKGVLGGWT